MSYIRKIIVRDGVKKISILSSPIVLSGSLLRGQNLNMYLKTQKSCHFLNFSQNEALSNITYELSKSQKKRNRLLCLAEHSQDLLFEKRRVTEYSERPGFKIWGESGLQQSLLFSLSICTVIKLYFLTLFLF